MKPRPECAIIDLGDAFVKLCGNHLYSAVHRVMSPPGEQAHSDRHLVLKFARPNSDVMPRSVLDDVHGQQEGLMNAHDWVSQRARTWNGADLKGKESYQASRGKEHKANPNGEGGKVRVEGLDKSRGEVQAVWSADAGFGVSSSMR